MWRDLERALESAADDSSSADNLVPVRLEMFLMKQVVERCLRRGSLDDEQHGQVLALLTDVGAMLDGGEIHAAQNRLLDEVLAENAEMAPDSRMGAAGGSG
jgi:hypothetical protein